jgi:NhaP-type Na+/H+ or K+/H+ antiporter
VGQKVLLLTTGTCLIALLFSVIYAMLKPKCPPGETCIHPGLPGGLAFDFLEVLILGIIGGKCTELIRLPSLLGQLIVGFLLRNIIPDQLEGMSAGTNSMLRSIALAIIMLRAGLGLDFEMLRKSSVSTMILSTGPCIGEATTIALIVKVIKPLMSWPFCFMLGFCIADVSPAVTTPILLDLNIQKRGTKKGVPTILLAAGSVNSVIAIVFYKIVEEFAWQGAVSPENLAEIIGVKFFVQVFGIGGIAGAIMGKIVVFLWCFTEDDWARFSAMFLVAMLALFGFKMIGMSGGGTLSVLMMGTTIHNSMQKHEIGTIEKPVAAILGKLWANIGAVMLFTLLGSSLDASKLSPGLVGYGILLVILGLVGRSITLFFTLFLFPQWGVKEKLYSMLSWCPKATVQAALATAALDHINTQITLGKMIEGSAQEVQFRDNAMVILTTAILSIIMTAPVFAVLMLQFAPILLEDNSKDDDGEKKDAVVPAEATTAV